MKLKKDIVVIENFLSYLDFNTNKLTLFFNLIKYDFIKKGFFYRLKVLGMILVSKNKKVK